MGVEVVDLIPSVTITEHAANSLQRNPPDNVRIGWKDGVKEIMATWIAKWMGNCRETEKVSESSEGEPR
jgi:hypothetical protein